MDKLTLSSEMALGLAQILPIFLLVLAVERPLITGPELTELRRASEDLRREMQATVGRLYGELATQRGAGSKSLNRPRGFSILATPPMLFVKMSGPLALAIGSLILVGSIGLVEYRLILGAMDPEGLTLTGWWVGFFKAAFLAGLVAIAIPLLLAIGRVFMLEVTRTATEELKDYTIKQVPITAFFPELRVAFDLSKRVVRARNKRKDPGA